MPSCLRAFDRLSQVAFLVSYGLKDTFVFGLVGGFGHRKIVGVPGLSGGKTSVKCEKDLGIRAPWERGNAN